MHHASPDSTGEISSEISWPYKHSPASVLRISLHPKPASSTVEYFNIFSHNSVTLEESTEICSEKPSFYTTAIDQLVGTQYLQAMCWSGCTGHRIASESL